MYRYLLAALSSLPLLSGCVSLPAGEHQPSFETVTTLRDSTIAKLNVGAFTLASGLDPALDRSISSRGNSIKPPPGSTTFSQYLKDSLIADLKAGGKYDPASAIVVRGELADSQLRTGLSTASAALAAHFYVVRSGNTVYDKVLHEQRNWESSVIGAVAIPEAMNQYLDQYSALLKQLYADPQFLKACAAAAP
jgi:hypothetical protein